MLRSAPCIFTAIRKPSKISNIRPFHDTVADFTSRDQQGKLVTFKVPVQTGKPHEAYVMIPPAVGSAFQTQSALDRFALDSTPADIYKLEKHQLTFFHDTQEFRSGTFYAFFNLLLVKLTRCRSLGSPSEYPRLKLPSNLPSLTDATKSPATLFLYGLWHTITLDGSADGMQYNL